jgi:hypothetical protein
MKFYLGVGVVLQVPDQVAAEVADIGLDLPDVVPKTVQLGDYDLVTVRAAVAVAPADDSPGHDDDQDADGSDYLGQPCEVFHLGLPLQGQHLIHLLPGQVSGVGQFGLKES